MADDSSSEEEIAIPGFTHVKKRGGSTHSSTSRGKSKDSGPNKNWGFILMKSFAKKDVHGRSFTIYEIVVVSDGGASWRIYRRFSQFYKLHEGLKKEVPSAKLNIPPKKLLGNLSPEFIEQRRAGLSNYLIELLNFPAVLKSKSLASFLDPNNNPSFALLLSPDKEGFLTKQAHVRKMLWKRRWFVLKGSSLYYFRTLQDSDPRGVYSLALSTVEIQSKPSSDGRKWVFKLKSKDPSKPSVYLSADSESEMLEWVTALRSANTERRAEGAQVGRSSFSESSPMAGKSLSNSSVLGHSDLSASSKGSIFGTSLASSNPREIILSSSMSSTGSLGSQKHSSSYNEVMKIINEKDQSEKSGGGANSDSDIEYSDDDEPLFAPTIKDVISEEDAAKKAATKDFKPPDPLADIKSKLVQGGVFSIWTGEDWVKTKVYTSESIDYLLYEAQTSGKKSRPEIIAFADCSKVSAGNATPTLEKSGADPSTTFVIFTTEGDFLEFRADSASSASDWVKTFTKAVSVRGAKASK